MTKDELIESLFLKDEEKSQSLKDYEDRVMARLNELNRVLSLPVDYMSKDLILKLAMREFIGWDADDERPLTVRYMADAKLAGVSLEEQTLRALDAYLTRRGV